jgi:ATP-dependent Clp protease adaptor protein ClpS
MQSPLWHSDLEEADLALDSGKDASLILHNDDVNTFDWVIKTLIDVCGHSSEQAEQSAYLVHFTGKCIVKEGDEPRLVQLKKELKLRGLSATVA